MIVILATGQPPPTESVAGWSCNGVNGDYDDPDGRDDPDGYDDECESEESDWDDYTDEDEDDEDDGGLGFFEVATKPNTADKHTSGGSSQATGKCKHTCVSSKSVSCW